MRNKHIALTSFLALGGAAGLSHAAVVTTIQFNSGNVLPSPIVAVSTDLLQTSVFSVTGEVANQNLRNGTTGTASDATVGDPANVGPSSFFTTTFDLDISTNIYGYDITEFRLFSGWIDPRASQNYEIAYSLVGSSSFATLLTVTNNQSGGSLLTRTYDDTSAPLISGVDAVRFNFLDPNGVALERTVYREIDVIGTATIPEPSAALLGGLGLLALLRRRR
jgi:MYXO-CTERM domain-containing protein